MANRNLSLDRARTFLTLVVLLHHAVIPYTYFGHNNPSTWIGFDGVVLATDSFFMAAFFFLSGLFVWRGIERKTAPVYLRDRFMRLGLPFAIGALVLIPLAYYAPALRENPSLGFEDYWLRMTTEGPWPSGPMWFLWVLLSFDVMASFLSRLSLRPLFVTLQLSWVFILLTWSAYIPLLLFFGAPRWFEFGPFAVQASRVLLYAAYFFTGASIGYTSNNLLRELPARRWGWLMATIVAYSSLCLMIYIKREILGNPPMQPFWYQVVYGTFFVLFSASILFAILAFFLNGNSARPNILDRMQADAYGIFLVHYPIVLWIHYFLYDRNWSAIAKAASAFLLSVVLSWGATVALRKIPGARQII